MTRDFRHLHVHTGFSIADGAMHIKDLVRRVKELGMDSVAITDHGNMYGVIDFYQTCKKEGIKPIIGMEAYVAPRANTLKESGIDNANYHLVLLCENNEGYQNLIKISSDAFINGMYYRPRTDIHKLKQWHNGIIALSACLGGEVQVHLNNGDYDKGKETALLYNEVFGDGNYFLELQDHGLPEQKKVNDMLLQIHAETGIPLVCTNDCHYMRKEDYLPHDVLMAIQAKTSIHSDKRKKYGSDQFYVKSKEEMYSIFKRFPSALENTCNIAERCNVNIEFGVNKLPKFILPEDFEGTAEEFLRKLVLDGAHDRYGDKLSDEVLDRVNYELSVIHRMGYDDYFLIVWDFLREAYERGILVGPGRGSAAGSIVSYCLKITALDPLKYDLMFERFLDPSRISMPDIDIDWQFDRRHEIIDYVTKRYGEKSVCQIITFGTMAAKGCIRAVARALEIPLGTADKVAKLIPLVPGITIEESLKTVAELKELYDKDSKIKSLIDISQRLEGLPAHTSVHAAGVVICGPEGLQAHIPVTESRTGVTTQYAMQNLDALGMLKMDFLGLRTLTVINDTIKSVKRNYGIDIDMYSLYDFKDIKPFSLLCEGKTDGLFQLESSGMTNFMQKLQPNCIEDVIAGISLYRPGPMDSIPEFLENRKNKNKIKYAFPELEPILSPTYGLPVYQEQAMQIVIAVAGYQKSQSDSFRKAIAKKKKEWIDAHREYFIYGKDDSPESNKRIGLKGAIPGVIKLGKDKKKAEDLYDALEAFGRYAFNKSHAAVYAAIAYITMYLKYYYPAEFMAATIDMDIKSKAKVMRYVNHCKDLGISLLPPDINSSFEHFDPKPDKTISYSLSAKDTDSKSLKAIIDERDKNGKFVDMTDYFRRCGKSVNKKTFRSLMSIGAFHSITPDRQRFIYNADVIYKKLDSIKNAADRARERGKEPRTTFENSFLLESLAPTMNEYTRMELLTREKEFSGSYLTGHPLDKYAFIINKIHSQELSYLDYDLEEETGRIVTANHLQKNEQITVIAVVNEIVKTQTRKDGKPMAILTIEDLTGICKAFAFSKIYPSLSDIMEENQVYEIHGEIMLRDDEPPSISITKMTQVEAAMVERAIFKINSADEARSLIRYLPKIKGSYPVYVNTNNMHILLNKRFWVDIELLKHNVSKGEIPKILCDKVNYETY